MSLYQLFSQIQQQLSINTTKRIQERASFVQKQVDLLQTLDLPEQKLVEKINGYLEYSSQGVFNALAFNYNLNTIIKSKFIEQIANYSFMYKLKTENIYYQNTQHNGIRAYYDETGQPQIVIICIGNNNDIYKVLPFADKEELQVILKNTAIKDCFWQFEANNMDAQTLIDNVLQLTTTRDKAFEILVEGIKYDLSKILLPLKNEFSLDVQLDKLLRNKPEKSKLEEIIILQLEQDGELGLYQKTRLNKNSILSETAQKRLIATLDASKLIL